MRRLCNVVTPFLVLAWVLLAASLAHAYSVPASVSATTEPAGVIGPTTAELHGIVNANGTAVKWQFQFGPSSAYNGATPMQAIPAGAGEVAVSTPLTSLVPLTVYHFRLVAISQPTNGDASVTSTGDDMSFTTAAAGWVRLPFLSLRVTRGRVAMPLRCDSQMSCAGRYLITTSTRVGHSTRVNVVCSTGSFSLNPQQVKRFRQRVTRRCLGLIRHRRQHRITVHVTATPTTSQFAFIKSVPLTS